MPIVAIVAFTVAAIEVEGSSTCPTGAEVTEQLEAMGVTDLGSRGVELRSAGEGVELMLWSEYRNLVAHRVLPAASCAELAHASAVVVATWSLIPEYRSTPLRRASSPRGAPTALASVPQSPLARTLQPALAAGARAAPNWATPVVALELAYLADDAFGPAFELALAGPLTSGQFGPSAPLGGPRPFDYWARVAGGGVYRNRVSTFLRVDLSFRGAIGLMSLATFNRYAPSFDSEFDVRFVWGRDWQFLPFFRAGLGLNISDLSGGPLPTGMLSFGLLWGRS